jgi:hypothetical protein
MKKNAYSFIGSNRTHLGRTADKRTNAVHQLSARDHPRATDFSLTCPKPLQLRRSGACPKNWQAPCFIEISRNLQVRRNSIC